MWPALRIFNIIIRGSARGGMGGRPPPKNLAIHETKLVWIRLPKVQKIARIRVRLPQNETRAAPLIIIKNYCK